MLTDARSLQSELKKIGAYAGSVDGDFGPASRAARDKLLMGLGLPVADWPEARRMIAGEQWLMMRYGIQPGEIDGFNGPSTLYALERWQNMGRTVAVDSGHHPATWPRQSGLQAFYGSPGTGHTMLDLPYPMRIAWDVSTTVTRITINKKCAESASRALKSALTHYGYDKICGLGLDLFGGCYNNRKMRGGALLSTHAYACALDINPSGNQLRWGQDRAQMATPDCAAFLNAFEAEGWLSLGREKNFDWMHLQAARF